MKKDQSNNKPLGSSVACKLNPGDFVEWSGWYLDLRGEVHHELYKGVLIEINSETMGEREVLYAKVLPINNNTVFDVNVLCLRKVTKKETS